MIATEPIIGGTPEWFAARKTLVTASNFKKVRTHGRDKKPYGDTARSYAMDLVAEALSGVPAEDQERIDTAAMAWGRQWEPVAIKEYINKTFLPIKPGGLVVPWPLKFKIGGTPDGFVGKDGLLEVKCPHSPRIHLQTVTSGEMPDGHKDQVQGNLWLTGRDWLDFVSFDPRVTTPGMRLFIKRIERDDDYIAKEIVPYVVPFEKAVRDMIATAERGEIPLWPEGLKPDPSAVLLINEAA